MKKSSFQGNRINPTKFSSGQIKFYAILIPLCIFMLLPIIYIVNQAFKPLDELFAFPPTFFVRQPTVDNFRDLAATAATTGVPMSRYLFNSIVVTILSLGLNLLFVVMSAYALSKKEFKAKKRLLSINEIALMFVGTAVAIPRYLVIIGIQIDNTIWAHILPALAMPVGLFLVKQFVDQVPDSLIEAAKIDGATDITIVRKVVIPLVKPALATAAILTFQAVWNSAEASNLYIVDETLKTFPFYLNSLTASGFSTATGVVSIAGAGVAAAASLITFLPNLIIFIFMQSNVMNTMAHSGIK